MQLSNYEIMRNQMRKKFLTYDQEKMIHKFQLDFDDDYLYMEFVSRNYRIGRKTGIVEWWREDLSQAVEADYNVSMTLYDVLCCSRENCRLSGEFCPLYMAKGSAAILHPGKDLYQKTAEEFRGRVRDLKTACGKLGTEAAVCGDVRALITVFPFLSVIFQYWEGDDEFPSGIKFLYDRNILDYMHFETVYLMTAHILERITEEQSINHAMED